MSEQSMQHTSEQRGFSLVEVIVAMALLGSVLIFISGLFVAGSRQVSSGRAHSTALSVARDIQEEMQSWPFHRLYDAYAISGTQNTGTVDSRNAGYAAKWQPLLSQQLQNAFAEIEVRGFDSVGGSPLLQSAPAVRVIVTVHWEEGLRPRRVQLVTVRM